MDNLETQNSRKNYWLAESRVLPTALWITIGSLVSILVFIVIYCLQFDFSSGKWLNTSVMGTFGDFIGGFFGTLFSLVTVFLVWLAYQSQQKELKEITNQGKEQIEIQALAALIPLYKQNIDELYQKLNAPVEMVAGYYDFAQEAKKSGEIREQINYYEFLLSSANKILLKKAENLQYSDRLWSILKEKAESEE